MKNLKVLYLSLGLSPSLLACVADEPQLGQKTASLDSCGSLCLSSDSTQLEIDPFTSFENDEPQSLDFDSAAGTVTIDVTVNGNFGRVGLTDGATISINGGTPCEAQERQYDDPLGCISICSNVSVPVVSGTNHIDVTFHQWNGSEGWTLEAGTATITLH